MRRRDLIAMLGGAAVAWPEGAGAQQRTMPVIGFLNYGPSDKFQALLAAFRDGLREEGYVEGQNVIFEFRYADGQRDRLPGLADELIQRQVSVIVTGTPAFEVMKDRTATISIVFVSGPDPVKFGYVQNSNRPVGNLTGVTLASPDLASKRIGVLHDLVPQAALIAIPWNPNASVTVPPLVKELRQEQVKAAQAAASALGLSNLVVAASSEPELDQAFETIARERSVALIVSADTFFLSRRDRVTALAASSAIPAIYELREFADAGGLTSYGPSLSDAERQMGQYAGRILKGAKPADLPIQLPKRYELVLNLKTAKALGLAVPPTLLAIADEVIE